ncbi:MAG: hypothetical protein ACRDI0_05030 [Actinomycetota bacterium]
MLRLLRRYQPRGVVLGGLYWVSLLAAAFAALFGLFFLLDSVFGIQLTPFDSPGV